MTVDWELDHVGVVVKDIDNAMKHYQRLGLELLDSPDLNVSDPNSSNIPPSSRSCFIQNEAIRIKLIQPVNGDNLFKDYLDSHGEGLNYIGFRTNELQKEKARLIEMGISVLNTTKRADGSEMEILFDTRKHGNVSIALFSEPISFPIFESSEGSWEFWHLGFVVKDIYKFADYYQSIGFKLLAPIRDAHKSISQDVLNKWIVYGKTPRAPLITRECRLQNKQGTFLLSASEPVEGKDLYQEFRDKHGEGVQHFHFLVKDLPKQLANMVSIGFPCIMTQKRLDDTLYESYYDTREVGNIIVALWSGKPAYKATPE